MKALVKCALGQGNAELRDIPEPTPGRGEVKCKVIKAGLCGSDMHVYHGEMGCTPPVVMGHEFIGRIVEVGEGVTKYRAGQRVSAEIGHYVCGKCKFCREGLVNMCVERKSMGYVYDGVFAEYVIIPERDIVLVPESIDATEAALIEPLACCCRACYDFAELSPEKVAVVIGPGPMGQMIAQICKVFGATVIVAGTTRGEQRLALAKQLGADHTVNTQKEDLRALCLSLTDNYGADVVFECSGTDSGVNLGLDALRKEGQFIQFAIHGSADSSVNWVKIIQKELRVYGAMSSVSHNWPQAVKLLEKRQVNLKPLSDSVFKLENWQDAIAKADSKTAYKVVFDIGEDN